MDRKLQCFLSGGGGVVKLIYAAPGTHTAAK